MLSPKFQQNISLGYDTNLGSLDSSRYDTPTNVVNDPSYLRAQYEGAATANTFRVPVLSDRSQAETGQVADELILDGGAYLLSSGPTTDVYVPSVYNVGTGPDASDDERRSELNDPDLKEQSTTYNDDSVRDAIAEYESFRSGKVFDAKTEITDPANQVYSGERDIYDINNYRGKVWYRDESGKKVYSDFETDGVDLSLVPDSIADAFTLGPEEIEAVYVVEPDNTIRNLDEYSEQDISRILSDRRYTLEVRWKAY
jgi:hypothetical protein